MPAAAVKGLIISLSIIAALSVAVLENPQVQEWLEEQRKKIAELLRSFGEELDPASRQAAEAFAMDGRTPANDESLRREATGSRDAVAAATGRSLSMSDASALTNASVRRVPIQGTVTPEQAEERRRKGREYLAKRNQEMYELRQRRKPAKEETESKSPSIISFDALVDGHGKLWSTEGDAVLPSAPSGQIALPQEVEQEMRQLQRAFSKPLLAGEAGSSSSVWQIGSQLADPFGDEYALDRSDTPKPPVPPKIALEDMEHDNSSSFSMTSVPPMPIDERSNTSGAVLDETSHLIDPSGLTYEEQEQLAIALSLSEAETASTSPSSHRQGREDEDRELKAAIEASLKDMEKPKPSRSTTEASNSRDQRPLVDFSPAHPQPHPIAPTSRDYWEKVFDVTQPSLRGPPSLAPTDSDHDELYNVTPQYTGVRLAGPAAVSISSATVSSLPFDPVREAAERLAKSAPLAFREQSFYSAHSSAPSPRPEAQPSHTEDEHPLIDLDDEEPIPRERTPTPTSRGTTVGFHTDSDSESDAFASVYGGNAPAVSRPGSEISNVEMMDATVESDIDMFSDDGDGIATPDSWTEVGSQDGDSDAGEHPPHLLQQEQYPTA